MVNCLITFALMSLTLKTRNGASTHLHVWWLWGTSLSISVVPFLKNSLVGGGGGIVPTCIEIPLWGPLFYCCKDPTTYHKYVYLNMMIWTFKLYFLNISWNWFKISSYVETPKRFTTYTCTRTLYVYISPGWTFTFVYCD